MAIRYVIEWPKQLLQRSTLFIVQIIPTSLVQFAVSKPYVTGVLPTYQALKIHSARSSAHACDSHSLCCRKAWKAVVQTQLADRFNLEVTVCHFPPGTSKWNPIEHRLFSEISKN